MIKALLFDFDGLIIETEEPIYRAWLELFQRYGGHLPLSLWVTIIGTNEMTFDPWQMLEQQTGHPIDRQAENTIRIERELELVNLQPVLPGVLDVLLAARQANLKTAVVSSSTRNWVQGHLERLGLLRYFDLLVTSEDVHRTKPDPELYQQAIQRLGVGPREAVVFEDSPNGLRAARAAGICAVAVPHELTRAQISAEADLVLHSLAEMPLSALLEAVSQAVSQMDCGPEP